MLIHISAKIPCPCWHKNNATNEIVELKGKREDLWRKHSRVKTDAEKQVICSEIGFLAKKIDELKKTLLYVKILKIGL